MTGRLFAMLVSIGQSHGLPAELLPAICHVESRCSSSVPVTRGEASGAFQLTPPIQRRYGVRDARNLVQAAHGAARYLRALQRRLGGWDRAISHFNGTGPAAERYLHRVLRTMGELAR